jgi:catechol 2,3-dioxygenase-like lactoylglutathione lyase family enzyme
MVVRGIVANIAADKLDAAKAFYGDTLGMNVVMNLGWIMTFAADATMAPQVSVAIEGGSGTPVRELLYRQMTQSDDHRRLLDAGVTIEYGPVTEPWGGRRHADAPAGALLTDLGAALGSHAPLALTCHRSFIQ